MRKFILFAFSFILLLGACNTIKGSGNIITENRQVSNFTNISVGGTGTVILTQGDEESLKIETDDNIISHIKTGVANKILFIEPEDNINLNPSHPIKYYITMKEINGLNLSGVVELKSEEIETTHLDLNISGSSVVNIDSLNTKILAVNTSGVSNCILSGQVIAQTINISGDGEYNAPKLESQTADVNVSGLGEVTIWVNDTLNVDISGSAEVNYYGNPTITQDVSGSGSINRVGGR